MHKYDVVFFDVDGTLIDSAPGILHTMQETFAEMGTDISGVDLFQYLGPPLRKTFSEYYHSEEEIERAVTFYRASYQEKGRYECELFSGVLEMLQELKKSGVAMYTATSKPQKVAAEMLKDLGIADYFQEIGGASLDTARDTKTAVIQDLLDKHDFNDKRVLMVGDRRDDMKGAADCNLPAAAVLYGYGSAAELEPFRPCILAKDCKMLTSYILKGELI